MEIQDLVIYKNKLPKRKAEYSEFPLMLHERIKNCLRNSGIDKLYSHEAEMFEAANREEHVVITTSTASGKTLSFLLPILQSILDDPLTRALIVYPTKALASEQFRGSAALA